MSTQILTRTREQQDVVARLTDAWGIDPEKILFLNEHEPLKPWLNSKALLRIARQSGEFQQVATTFADFIPALSQIVWSSTVVTRAGQSFTRSGVARIGEKLPNEEVADEHELAGARALRAALDDAGFDPTTAAPPVMELKLQTPAQFVTDHEAETRLKDLARIHILAAEAGLIVPRFDDPGKNDTSMYEQFLGTHFKEESATESGVPSTAGMGAADRARVINGLTQMLPTRSAARA